MEYNFLASCDSLAFVPVGSRKRQPSSRSVGCKCQTLNVESSSEVLLVFFFDKVEECVSFFLSC